MTKVVGLGGRCPGCGASFQHSDETLPGYVSAEVWAGGEDGLLCRRCYRATHYGELSPVAISDEAYQTAVRAAVLDADVVWLVVDVADFAGSFAPGLLSLAGGRPVIIVGNKVDLLPPKAVRQETVAWVRQQAQLASSGNEDRPQAVALTSGATGEGIENLLGLTRRISGAKGDQLTKVAVIGVTNTGKSSVLSKALKMGGGLGSPPTVSKYPGTTIGLLRRSLPDRKLTLIDSPGVIPPGRVSDLVCDQCLEAVVPAKGLNSKLFSLAPGRALLLGGLCAITVESCEAGDAVLLAFAAQGVKLHQTSGGRIEALLAQRDLLTPPCGQCGPEVALGEAEVHELRPNQDFAIPGLGWVSVRRAPVTIGVRLPAGVRGVVRSALIGPRPLQDARPRATAKGRFTSRPRTRGPAARPRAPRANGGKRKE